MWSRRSPASCRISDGKSRHVTRSCAEETEEEEEINVYEDMRNAAPLDLDHEELEEQTHYRDNWGPGEDEGRPVDGAGHDEPIAQSVGVSAGSLS
jgi:hypothetical protein